MLPFKTLMLFLVPGVCDSAIEAALDFFSLLFGECGSAVHHCVVPLPAKNKDPVRRMGKSITILHEEEPSLDQIWISSSFKVRRLLNSVWAHLFLNLDLKSGSYWDHWSLWESGSKKREEIEKNKMRRMNVGEKQCHTFGFWNAEWSKIHYSPLTNRHSVLASLHGHMHILFPRLPQWKTEFFSLLRFWLLRDSVLFLRI